MIKSEIVNFNIDTISKPVKRILELIVNGLNIIALYGEVGVGKTTIVNHICKMKNINNKVSSPTYSILNIYNNKNNSIYHFDLYRLNSINDVVEVGLFEYIDSTNICFIEWPEMIKSDLPKNTIHAYIEHNDNEANTRNMTLKYTTNI